MIIFLIILIYLFIFTNQDFETCLINPGSGKNTTRYLCPSRYWNANIWWSNQNVFRLQEGNSSTTYYTILHTFQTRPLALLVVPGLCIQPEVNCFLYKKLSSLAGSTVGKPRSQSNSVHWSLKRELNFQCLKGQTLHSCDSFEALTLAEHLWNKVGEKPSIYSTLPFSVWKTECSSIEVCSEAHCKIRKSRSQNKENR